MLKKLVLPRLLEDPRRLGRRLAFGQIKSKDVKSRGFACDTQSETTSKPTGEKLLGLSVSWYVRYLLGDERF